MRIVFVVLALSLLANGWFVWKHFNPPPEPPKRTAAPTVYLDPETFDFSKTGLSDEAYKLDPVPMPPPQEAPPPAIDPPPLADPKIDLPALRDLPPSTDQ